MSWQCEPHHTTQQHQHTKKKLKIVMYVVQIFALHRWPHVGCYSCYVCHRSATVCMNVRFMTWHTYIHVLLCVCVCDTPHPPPFSSLLLFRLLFCLSSGGCTRHGCKDTFLIFWMVVNGYKKTWQHIPQL